MANYVAPSPAGLRLGWTSWDTTQSSGVVLRWENEGWTAEGWMDAHNAQFVIRLSAQWRVQQFLLFRDMSEPDLWLATDDSGRWGEINGAHRIELDGCMDIDLAGTPFTNAIPIRRLPLRVGDAVSLRTILVDVDSLGISVFPQTYSRLGTHSWRYTSMAQKKDVDVEVDEFGFVTDEPGVFRRIVNQ